MKGFFITGTNTGRGKTLISAGIRLWLEDLGLRTLVMKAVQTGMEGHRVSPDLHYILSGGQPDQISEEEILDQYPAILEKMQPYCYSQPCSPHLAAELDGCEMPEIQYIYNCARELQEENSACDLLLVEGSGGLFVPIHRQKKLYVMDIAEALGFPVILVGHNGLGAINDCCLSLYAMQKQNLPVAGFILNHLESPGPENEYILQDNPKIIEELTGFPCLGVMPYLSDPKLLLRGIQTLENLSLLKEYL